MVAIGGRDILVREVDELPGDGQLGEADYHKSEIRVVKGQSKRVLLDTLLHEWVHQANFVNGWAGKLADEDEEAVATTLGSQLAELFVRNPEFVKVCQKLAR